MLARTFNRIGACNAAKGLETAPEVSNCVPQQLPTVPTMHIERGQVPRGRTGRSLTATFFRVERGGVAVESAVAIAVLVVLFGGLMAIVHAAYTDDRMGRAARVAARAVALETDTSLSQAALVLIACNAIRQELDLQPDFNCATTWTVTITTGLTPTALATGVNSDGETGDMVLVELGWSQLPWARAAELLEGSGAGTAIGVARREPAIRVPVPATDEEADTEDSDTEEAADEDSDTEEATDEESTESSASRDGARARWACRAAPLESAPLAATGIA